MRCLDIDIKYTAFIACFLSTISLSFVQKTKCFFPWKNYLCLYSLIVNLIFGVLFCLSFTKIVFPNSLWVGVFSFLGSDTLYKILGNKLLSYDEILRKRKNNGKS